MNSGGSITHWINEIKDGNRDAAQGLWERYFARLVRLARFKMSADNRRVSDEEDIAISVFEAFCRAAENGRFPDLSDRDGLWRLLVKMTARKAIDERRKQNRLRRGGGEVRGESVFSTNPTTDEQNALAQVIGDEPTPEFVAMMTEQLGRIFGLLTDPKLKELAMGKLEGYTNEELAQQQNCSERTIARRLKLIRLKCKEEFLD